MAKQSGLADAAFVAGYDLSGDISALDTIRGGPMALDVTAINASAHERIGGLRDGEISFTSWFNDATGKEHLTLRGLPSTDIHVMYCRGSVLANAAAAIVAKQVNYDGTRGADGSFSFKVQSLANAYGLTWCLQLTAGSDTITGAGNGTGVDFGGGGTLAFGLVAFLQVTAFTGTDVTLILQESSDNGGGDAFAAVTGGGFTQITTAPVTQRIVTTLTQNVERYLRWNAATSGGFSSLTFALAVCRHETATAY